MFRLIKLAIYALLGYAIYEFCRGLLYGEEAVQSGGGRGGSRQLNAALNRGRGRSNITGPGRGERVTTSEPSGESVSHTVGRGVVRK